MNSMAGSATAPHFDEAALKRGAGSVRHPLARALLALTFTTGLVDAVSHLALGRVFTANMTGNVVLLGFGIARSGGLPVVAPLVSLGAFLIGAGAGGVLVRRLAQRHPMLVARTGDRDVPARRRRGRRGYDNSPAGQCLGVRAHRPHGLRHGCPQRDRPVDRRAGPHHDGADDDPDRLWRFSRCSSAPSPARCS